MDVFGRIAKGNGEIVVSRQVFRGTARIDLREFYEADGEARATRRGVNLPIAALPRLRAALEDAETSALRGGLITADHYRAAGLEPPAALQEEAS